MVFWRLAMALAPQRESWGTAPLSPTGQREGGDGTPPRGRRPTVVEVRTWVSGIGGQGSRRVWKRGVFIREQREVGGGTVEPGPEPWEAGTE